MSNPFSTNKRCVSVIDIFSIVFNDIGIGSVALSIRICDIKCAIAFDDGLVADSFPVVDVGREDGSGGATAKQTVLL